MSYELREARHGASSDGARPVSTFQLSTFNSKEMDTNIRIAPKVRAFTPKTGAFAPKTGAFTPKADAFTPKAGAFTPKADAFTPKAGDFMPKAGDFAPKAGTYFTDIPLTGETYKIFNNF
jgi:hypothetical protein